MYRKIGLPNIGVGEDEIPDYIAEMIDKEDSIDKKTQEVSMHFK